MYGTTTSPDYRRGQDDGKAGKRPDPAKLQSEDYMDGWEDGYDEWQFFDGDR